MTEDICLLLRDAYCILDEASQNGLAAELNEFIDGYLAQYELAPQADGEQLTRGVDDDEARKIVVSRHVRKRILAVLKVFKKEPTLTRSHCEHLTRAMAVFKPPTDNGQEDPTA
jgi:hypothetical protein